MLPAEPAPVTNFRHALIRMETFMAGMSLLLLLALVFGQVVARNLFNSSIPSADILSRYMVLYVTFFGAALAVEYHKHIRIDVVAACLPPERCRRMKPLLFLISTVLCAFLTWAAMRFWYDDWQYVAQHERWSSVLALITPFGFGLLTLHFFLGTLFEQRDEENGS